VHEFFTFLESVGNTQDANLKKFHILQSIGAILEQNIQAFLKQQPDYTQINVGQCSVNLMTLLKKIDVYLNPVNGGKLFAPKLAKLFVLIVKHDNLTQRVWPNALPDILALQNGV